MSEWISVKDDLPKDGQHILMACKGGDVVKGMKNGKDWWGDNQNWRGDGQVTHWMPLPAPPDSVKVEVPTATTFQPHVEYGTDYGSDVDKPPADPGTAERWKNE